MQGSENNTKKVSLTGTCLPPSLVYDLQSFHLFDLPLSVVTSMCYVIFCDLYSSYLLEIKCSSVFPKHFRLILSNVYYYHGIWEYHCKVMDGRNLGFKKLSLKTFAYVWFCTKCIVMVRVCMSLACAFT